MKKKCLFLLSIFPIALILWLFIYSCGSTKLIRSVHAPASSRGIDPKSNYLKVHMRDGNLYILKDWVFEYKPDTLWGVGNHYDMNRKLITGTDFNSITANSSFGLHHKIPNRDIVLIESNKMLKASGNLAAITIVGVPFGIMSSYCLANPKACFGSCPTFYSSNGNKMELMAEGFSSSILPVFEKKDVDMLYWAKPGNGEFFLKLTNEALETHIIRYADLLVFPVDEGERIFASKKGQFYNVAKIFKPLFCTAGEENIIPLISDMDHKEWFSEADSKNLAEREYIQLEFAIKPGDNYGLLLGTRQTLLTTWLFYQSLAYAGTMAGDYAAAVERGDKGLKKKVNKVWDLLGGIEIFLMDRRGNWNQIEELREMGPIASDIHLVEFPSLDGESVKLKLRMTKGLWRIDYLALAALGEKTQAQRIKPAEVWTGEEKDDLVKQILHDTLLPLITYPGDQYILSYVLPEGDRFEVFLESKGYYLEWMREEWLAEEDQKKAALMFLMPGLYLKKAAGAFKEVEPLMEENFWGSRYVRN